MTEKNDGQPQSHKSRKEVVILAISALVFAIVIYRVYLTGGSEEPPVVNETQANEETQISVQDVFKRAAQLEVEYVPPKAAPVERDPFRMTDAMRDNIYAKSVAAEDTPPPPVILTKDGMRDALAKIPGGEQAAEVGFRLDAVLVSPDWRCAVINEKLIPLGGTLLGFTLVQIDEDRVTLELNKHKVTLLVSTPQVFADGVRH